MWSNLFAMVSIHSIWEGIKLPFSFVNFTIIPKFSFNGTWFGWGDNGNGNNVQVNPDFGTGYERLKWSEVYVLGTASIMVFLIVMFSTYGIFKFVGKLFQFCKYLGTLGKRGIQTTASVVHQVNAMCSSDLPDASDQMDMKE